MIFSKPVKDETQGSTMNKRHIIRRSTGKKISLTKDMTIVLLGETGSGKTTFNNVIPNFLDGRAYHDERLVAVPQNKTVEVRKGKSHTIKMDCNIDVFEGKGSEQTANQAKSQTTKCSIYKYLDKETGYTLKVVDPPGLNDTNGLDQDKLHVKEIVDTLMLLQGVNIVCIVTNGCNSRLSKGLELALKTIKEMFTKEFLPNFIVCQTHLPKMVTPLCTDLLNDLNLSTENTFKFDNSCFIHPNDLKAAYDKCQGDKKKLEDLINENAKQWEFNRQEFEEMLQVASQREEVQTEAMSDLYFKKALHGNVINSQAQLTQNLEIQKKRLQDTSKQIDDCKRIIEENKDCEGTITKVEKKIVKEKTWKWIPKKVLRSAIVENSESVAWWALRIVSLGTVFLGEVLVDAANAAFHWIKSWEEVEEEVEKYETTKIPYLHKDKKKIKEENERNLKYLEQEHEEVKSKIRQTEEQIGRSQRIIAHLEKQMETEGLGYNRTYFEDMIEICKIELELAKKNKSNYKEVDALESHISAYKFATEIIKEARNFKDTVKLTDKDNDYLNSVLKDAEETQEESKKQQRQALESMKPFVINMKETREETGMMKKISSSIGSLFKSGFSYFTGK